MNDLEKALWDEIEKVVPDDAGLDYSQLEEIYREQLILGLSGLNPEYLEDEDE